MQARLGQGDDPVPATSTTRTRATSRAEGRPNVQRAMRRRSVAVARAGVGAVVSGVLRVITYKVRKLQPPPPHATQTV